MKLKIAILLLHFCLLVELSLSQTTQFVDKDSKLEGYAEKNWFKENIPFVELPNKEIEDVYYYRWTSHKRHLRYTVPGVGYSTTEFVHQVSYSGKFDSLIDAAGHHIHESRWLRNAKYAEDYINLWAREGVNTQQFSEWVAHAAWTSYLVSGNEEFIKSQQQGFVRNFNEWDNWYESEVDMYFISPLSDAMEHSASSQQFDSNDTFFGGVGYRPSFNSELYANAKAIANIARLNGDLETAKVFDQKAETIKNAILNWLWDDERSFFFHMWRLDNPNHELLDTREEIGFFPWRFGVIDSQDPKYTNAWRQLFDPEAFSSTYGPTTCEQRSPRFDGNQTSQCCYW